MARKQTELNGVLGKERLMEEEDFLRHLVLEVTLWTVLAGYLLIAQVDHKYLN